MTFASIRGGFDLSDDDVSVRNVSKALTKVVNERLVQVGAVFLKPSSKFPIDEDWYNRLRGDVDLSEWIDQEDKGQLNVGFNLQFGWMDVDIDADDPEYNQHILMALDYLGLDTRLRFGRRNVGYPTHVLMQLSEDDAENYSELKKFEPKQVVLNRKRAHVQLRSDGPRTKEVSRSAKQTVVPGSIYPSDDPSKEYDLSVWYTKDGKVADDLRRIADTTPRRCDFTSVVRAVAFGTMSYILRDHWVEGSRQNVANVITGWLARLVDDGKAINNHPSVSVEVFCPVDTDIWAESLIRYICTAMGDDEAAMRIRSFHDAREKLDRNPDAKVPGWHSLNALLGAEAMLAVRAVLTPGSDVSVLTKMADRYVYNEADGKYIDRERHRIYDHYSHEATELERRHKSDTIFIGGKPREAFKIFESSTMRNRVGNTNMRPDLDPGVIYRIDMMNNVVPDEIDHPASIMFNSWRGWAILPTDEIDPKVMEDVVKYTDRLFGLITRENQDQMTWLKKWIAWIFQKPAEKQQIAPVIIGDQGVGKSFFGETYMKALFSSRLWGVASANLIGDKFNISPFLGKMFVFIDEAKFNNEIAVEEIKKLVRSVSIGGAEKFENAKVHDVYARMAFASNHVNLGISQRDRRDRALFYIRTYDKAYLGKTETEFKVWAETLKPWFDDFDDKLRDPAFLRHMVRYYFDYPTTMQEVESIKYSSVNDPEIVEANQSWTRKVARGILESGWIKDDGLALEVPFSAVDWRRRVALECKEMGIPTISSDHVMLEYKQMNILETVSSKEHGRMLRFTLRWADVCDMYEMSTSVPVNPYRDFDMEDRGINTTEPGALMKRRASKSSMMMSKF